MVMHGIALMFSVTSDALTGTVDEPDGGTVRFYFDSPRLTILDLSKKPSGEIRLAIDLRRDNPRAVVQGPGTQAVVFSRMARGVVDGTLERVLIDYVTALATQGDPHLDVKMGTSVLFELAVTQQVPAVVLPGARNRLAADIPADALARLDAETARGYAAVVPERAVAVAGLPRYAWWRVDPKSGETVAVTDEGLYQEYVTITRHTISETTSLESVSLTTGRVLARVGNVTRQWPGGLPALLQLLRASGVLYRVITRNN
jgi:hypothetical protein